MEAIDFARRYLIPAIAAAIGAILVVGGYALMAVEVFQLGLPVPAWQGIGAVVFFSSIFALLVRWDRDHRKSDMLNSPMANPPTINGVSQTPAGESRLDPRSVLLADLVINFARVSHPSPWLDFSGVGFNGSPIPLRVLSATGRVRVAAVDFPASLELARPGLVIGSYSLFAFNLSLPLNDRGAEYVSQIEQDLMVAFTEAKLLLTTEVRGIDPPPSSLIEVTLPYRIAFKKSGSSGEPQPRYFTQIMR